jgi:hypothetical protein
MFDAMGIPRRPVDDQTVAGVPWNSDDMVSFGRAIREGFLEICTDDVERLTGRPARSTRRWCRPTWPCCARRRGGKCGCGCAGEKSLHQTADDYPIPSVRPEPVEDRTRGFDKLSPNEREDKLQILG